MTNRNFRSLAAAILGLLVALGAAQEPLLWGSLKPGPYAVGFRSSFLLDVTRQYDSDYPLDSSQPYLPKPRPILFAVWYPCRPGVVKMTQGGYLDFPTTASTKPFVDRFKPFLRDLLATDIFGKEESRLSPSQSAAYGKLLAMKTIAVRNASPIRSKFPVLIDHPGLGGPYQDNAVFFEYLASHGYVVISSAYQGYEGTALNIDWNLDRSFADLTFLAHAAGELPFADGTRIAVMGHSSGGQATIAWASRPFGNTAAVISLDSGLEVVPVTYPSIKLLGDTMEAWRNNLRCPVLRFTKQSDEHDFGYLAPYLKYAADYRSTVGGVRHNDFITDGAIRPSLLPEEWPDKSKAAAVRTSYDGVCTRILAFLDAHLKNDAAARQTLTQSERNDGPLTLQIHPAAPFPPTARQLAEIVRRAGLDRAMEILGGCRNDVDLGGDGIGGAANILSKEGRSVEALDLVSRCTRMYPDSMAMFCIYAGKLAKAGRKDEALAAYRQGLANVQKEKADAETKTRWTAEIERYIRELGGSPAR